MRIGVNILIVYVKLNSYFMNLFQEFNRKVDRQLLDWVIYIGGELLPIVTITILQKAFYNTLGKKGMPHEELDNLAIYILNFFGFNEYVIDNKLTSKDRDVFYMLEEEGILKTRRDEVTLQKGKVWRIHYWILDSQKVIEMANPEVPEEKKHGINEVYEDLPEDIWERHSE